MCTDLPCTMVNDSLPAVLAPAAQWDCLVPVPTRLVFPPNESRASQLHPSAPTDSALGVSSSPPSPGENTALGSLQPQTFAVCLPRLSDLMSSDQSVSGGILLWEYFCHLL